MKIQHTDQLATTSLRQDACAIVEAGLAAIDTQTVIRESITLEGDRLCVNDLVCTLHETRRVFVVGVGKCSLAAAEALEEVLGDKLAGGVVCDVRQCEQENLKKITAHCGTHPFPSETNISITKEIIELLHDLKEEDLVLVVVSGGGSTLLCNPDEGMTCVNEQTILKALFVAGATIQEINTIRKHTSLARGGFLAQYAYPAQVIGLVFSDVPGNQLDMIASGPTIKDTTTIEDADAILARYNVLTTCNIDHCGLIETPKDDRYFKNVQNVLLVSNDRALSAMQHAAVERGYAAEVCSTCMSGEAREQGMRIVQSLHTKPPRTALLYGGETTVTIQGEGTGGRNQELALAALQDIQDGELVLSIASDGWDNSEHAGALADTNAAQRARDTGLDVVDHLTRNDSFNFFSSLDSAVTTGYTGSNVSDLVIGLKE